MAAYEALCKEAEQDYAGYWARLAKEHVVWKQPFTQSLDESNAPFYKWFADGKLNVSYNCLDRNIEAGLGDKVAIIFEADGGQVTKVTYKELLSRVCQVRQCAEGAGHQEGRPRPDLHADVHRRRGRHAGLRPHRRHPLGGVRRLLRQVACRSASGRRRGAVITADEQCRGGKNIPLKPAVDEALAMGGCESIKTSSSTSAPAAPATWWPAATSGGTNCAGQSDVCEPEWVDAEHPLFLLYTSGSTGKPKGVQHSSGGYLLHAILTMKWTFDIKPDDVFWCTADIGWVTGHTYITYGPLACGATEIVFEGVPTYPDAGRFWKMIQDHKVNIFYTAPTAIRSLIKAAETTPADASEELRPVQPAHPGFGRRADQSGSLDVVLRQRRRRPLPDRRHLLADRDRRPHDHPAAGRHAAGAGFLHAALPGHHGRHRRRDRHDVEWGKGGFLVVKKPWPSMIRTIWGDPERFKKSYFPEDFGGKLYLAGDGAVRDAKTGYFTIMGRIDDVLNVSGHRMGTMEIESALVSHPLVAEAAVVGRPDDLTGEAICAFVVLKQARPPATRPRRSPTTCATGSARRSARSPSRRTSASATTCPRPAPARSCAACCAAWPRARRSPRTSPRWRTRDPGPAQGPRLLPYLGVLFGIAWYADHRADPAAR
jgi:acetyl-CoA synthetase